MKYADKTGRLCVNVIKGVSGAVIILLLLANLVYTSYVSYSDERVSIERTGFLPFAAAAFIFVLLFFFIRMEEKISEKTLFAVCSAVFLAAGIRLIVNSDGALRSDPLYCYEAAQAMADGDYSALSRDGYLHYFPHQLGIVTYERILNTLHLGTKCLYFFNLAEAVGILFLLWRTADLLFHRNHAVNLATILLSFLFLPQLFYILFAYGLIPGYFCLMAAFFSAEKYFATQKRRYPVLMAIASCLAAFLKKNFLIGVIAIVLWMFCRGLRERKYRLLLVAAVLLPCCLAFTEGMQKIYQLESGIEMGEGVPSALYIGMGINNNNLALGPGWYDGSVWSYFTQCGQDREKAEELAGELLAVYFGQMRDNPIGAIKFFAAKTVSVWCDPMFQSVWSGPLEKYGQYMRTAALQSLYRGEAAERAVNVFMKGYMLLLLFLNCRFCIKERRNNSDVWMLLLYTTGGFLFHIFWEAKSQYIYPYVFVMIPAAGHSLAALCRGRKAEEDEKNEERVA